MIAFNEAGQKILTFTAGSGLTAGEVCKMTANATVGPCDEDDSFVGLAVSVRGGVAGVVLEGYVELPYSGTAPSLGTALLLADGDGGVAADDEAGRACLVVSVDTTNHILGVML